MNTRGIRVLIAMTIAAAVLPLSALGQQPNANLNRVPVRPDIRLRFPDLVVTRIQATGRASIVNGAPELPLTVTVKNQGLAPAGVFKVAVEFSRAGGGGSFVVAFTVDGEGDIWYPRTDAQLLAGKSVTFTGRLRFNEATHGRVSLRALGDSCSGEEFVEKYCHVRESNETNNKSSVIWVVLP